MTGFTGSLRIKDEFPLEQLRCKLPDLNKIDFNHGNIPDLYVREFCGTFPGLVELWLPPDSSEYNSYSEEFVDVISSLQHLRILGEGEFTNKQIRTLTQKLPNLEKWFLGFGVVLSSETLVRIGQMTQLECLGMHMLNVLEVDMFPPLFSALKELEIYGSGAGLPVFRAGLKLGLANSRPAWSITFSDQPGAPIQTNDDTPEDEVAWW